MARIVRLKDSYQTDLPERQPEQISWEEKEGITGVSWVSPSEEDITIGYVDFGTASSPKEITEKEDKSGLLRGHEEDEDSIRNQHAKANALMDSDCLRFLELFTEKEYFGVDQLADHIGEYRYWLKIALLVRADYLQVLDSTLRITPEGQAALADLNKLKAISKEAII